MTAAPRPRRAAVAVAVVLALGVAGCSAGRDGSPHSLAWQRVGLPREFAPNVLASDGTAVLVGGRTPSRRVQPRLVSVAGDLTTREVPLEPVSGYAFEATWRSISARGDAVVAVGGAEGGAHGNVRWNAWSGSPTRVRELPQVFGAFGGVGAGDLIGATSTTEGPVIAGTWVSANSGLDAAVWLLDGATWVRQSSAGTAMESTPDLLVSPHAVASAGPSVVLAGSVVQLVTGDVRQRAAAWRSQRLAGGWARIDLPDAGARSEAGAISCRDDGCFLAGYVDGQLALWSLTGAHARRLAGVPPAPADVGTKITAPMVTGNALVQLAATPAGAAVFVRRRDNWRAYQGPTGIPVAAVVAGEWLYVVTQRADGSAALLRCSLRAISA